MKLIDFYADWCGPCQSMQPIIDELIDEGYDVEKINIENQPEKAIEYSVMSIPTFIIEDAHGNIVHRMSGAQPKDKLQTLLSE